MKQGARIELTVEEQGDHYAVRQEVNGSVGALIAALASLSGAIAELCRKAGASDGMILTKLADKEAEKNEPQYAERIKLYDDIRCDRLMTTCSWCYGRIGPHDKFCKHCGREFRDGSTSSKEAPNV